LSLFGTSPGSPNVSVLVSEDNAFYLHLLTASLDEGTLRRTLFEETGGSYPELITRHDIKVFLPPIGGLTVYIFGDPAKMSDPDVRLALRVHDECNGSDVFGSDICTCRPYLIFGVEEAVKEAQKGGSGVVIYFRKEGRALGEVTKYLVYNARKRGEDRASEYFQRTENIAGVKDMRFQALMPDVSHPALYNVLQRLSRVDSAANRRATVDSALARHHED
jgi:GTP cyclohydrolase II